MIRFSLAMLAAGTALGWFMLGGKTPRPEQTISPAKAEKCHACFCPECAKKLEQGLGRKVKSLVDAEMKARFNVLGVGSNLPRVKK